MSERHKSSNWIKSVNDWIDWLRFTVSVLLSLSLFTGSTPALHHDKTGICAVIHQILYSCSDTSTFKTITSTNQHAFLSLRAIIRWEWVCSNQSDGTLKRELRHNWAITLSERERNTEERPVMHRHHLWWTYHQFLLLKTK